MSGECCDKYTESILFEYDLFPSASGQMIYNLEKNGIIKKVKYYLDSSCDDSINIDFLYKNRTGDVGSIIQFADGGNSLIKGTNNNQLLEFDCNIMLKRADQIIINMVSGSASDVTIMAIINVEYEGGML
jgi:hypothetical protein